ncbi:hypothetical protein ACVWWI_000149 [Bradyrhizobium sp. USDA 3686]|nr:hypothetical protein [Bradyrhizobium canariense]MBM7486735.1 hypothetical protein [Bradyrhizobium canariense]
MKKIAMSALLVGALGRLLPRLLPKLTGEGAGVRASPAGCSPAR